MLSEGFTEVELLVAADDIDLPLLLTTRLHGCSGRRGTAITPVAKRTPQSSP